MTNVPKGNLIIGGFFHNDILYGLNNADSKVYIITKGKDDVEEVDFSDFFVCPVTSGIFPGKCASHFFVLRN